MSAFNQKTRRLPGFRFEAAAPARDDVLPRMDVALFVGFASSGPLGIPVAVESSEQFKTIFGEDLPLVWDAEKGKIVYALLAPTVRSFFRNGGKRCWILRVARLEPNAEKPLNRACFNYFQLSGLAVVNFGENKIENLSPAFARARSKGSWSDDLQIGTAVLTKSTKLLSLSGSGEEKVVLLEIAANETITSGELIRLSFLEENLILFLAVDKVFEDRPPVSPLFIPSSGKKIVEFSSRRFLWLKKLSEEISSAESYTVQIKMWTGQKNANSGSSSESSFRKHTAQFRLDQPKGKILTQKVVLTLSNLKAGEVPSVGSLLLTKLKNESICLLVETVNFGIDETAQKVEINCRAVGFQRNINHPATAAQTERLLFEIWVKKENEAFLKLSDLAFNADNERFWGDLPVDEDRYSFAEITDQNIPSWTKTGAALNFPLAGSGDREGFYFPIFAAALPETYLGALPLLGTKLQRNGLEEFDENLFLDSKLKNTGFGNLLNDAEFIRYLSPRPRPLWGIHSALMPETAITVAVKSSPTNQANTQYSLDECTIISVPDVLHRGWAQTADEGLILSPPVFSPPLRPEWWHFQDCRKPAVKKVKEPLWGNFLDCGIRVIKAPEILPLKVTDISSGKFTISWESDETDENLELVLEESTSPKFEFAREIYRGKQTHFEILEHKSGVYLYRVRAEIKQAVSDWSIGLAVKIPAAENWVLKANYDPGVLFAVQRAILRMCAARGDIFAVLDLPEHFNETESFTHLAMLKTTKGLTSATAGVEPFSADETKVLSFGAIYYPWLLTHEDDFEGFRNIPPDGAICGVMARRSNERGAWIAPANERLQGILGLGKKIERERFLDFQDNLINLVRQEPQGFLVLDSDTLSDDPDLCSINVRRLLSLLRRLALKHGTEYVFEPNNERFRRQVQRGFAALLDLMFVRGAFAGATPATSFQVVVGETINNFQSVEQGRFIIELRVAPSLPLKFVTVRLIQEGARSNITEVF